MRLVFQAGMSCCFAGLLLAACLAGCAKAPPPVSNRYVPTSENGAAAIAVALEDWKAGNPMRAIPTGDAVVQVIDNHRKKGQTLTDFEILGEVPGEAPCCFAARLKLANPDADEKVRYVVVGIDPLWVFRHEDYELLGHWDHAMPGTDDKTDDNKEGKEGNAKP